MKYLKPRSSGKTIFLTGASGVVGQALLEKLSGHTIIGLTHRTSIIAPNIIGLQGDITKPWFGLSHDDFNDLAQRVDYIIHTAAITDFAQPDEVIFSTNIQGTRNVLELGSVAQAGLFHISTAFVHPHNQTVEGNASYAYVYSKREAECMVRESGLPYTMIRPSIIVGDSQTGAIAKFQGFHLMVGLVLMELLPVVPVLPQYYIDFVPQDVVAMVVADLIHRDQIGGEWWLTAGEQALSVRAVVDLCVEHAHRLMGHPVAPPRVVDYDVFERLIRPVFLPALPRRLQKTLLSALQLTKTCIAQPFPTSLPELEGKLGISLAPSTELTLLRNLEYWATRKGYGAKRAELEQAEAPIGRRF